MTDGEHNGHSHFVVFNPAEQVQRRQMAHHAALHAVHNFVHSLTEEQLESFSMLMHSLADPNQGPLLASNFEGAAQQILHFKFGWCVCGERHSTAEDLLATQPMQPSPVRTGGWYDADSDPMGDVQKFRDKLFGGEYEPDASEADAPEAVDAVEIEAAAVDKKLTLMAEYNLIYKDGKYLCKLCGVEYSSIRDRMLRAPHDCPSCNIKNSQG